MAPLGLWATLGLWLTAGPAAAQPALLSAAATPGVGVVAPLLLSLTRARNVRCVFLLWDDDLNVGLLGAAATSELRRRLSWAGIAVALQPFARSVSSISSGCVGRELRLLMASDDANARFLKQVFEGTRSGPALDAMWLVFALQSSVAALVTDVALPYDSEILVAKQYRQVTEITEVWRVAPGQPLREAVWGRFSRGALRPSTRALYDRRDSLQGARISVVTQHYPPFALVSADGSTAEGFLGGIWRALEHKLNFTTLWSILPESARKDSSFLELSEGRADVALLDFTLTHDRLLRADFSAPILFTSYRVFIADAGYRLINWMSYLDPFRPALWAVELLTMLTLAVALAASYHLGRFLLGPDAALEDDDSYTLYNSLFYIFGAFCMQGHDVTPRSCALRVVYLVAYMTAIILMAAYSAALISFLAVQATALPFADVAGLLTDGRYAFAAARNSSGHQIILETTDPLLKRLAEPALNAPATAHGAVLAETDWPPDYLTGLQELCRRRLALLSPLEYAVTFVDRVGCKVVPLPGFSLRVGMAFAFAKSCPYRRVINHNLDRMRKSGAITKLLLDARPAGGGDATAAPGLTDVDLGDVAPLLAALAAGSVAAALFLGAEWLMYRRKGATTAGAASPPPTHSPVPALSHLLRSAKKRCLV